MSAVKDGWPDGHLLACPRVCAYELGYSGPPRRVHLEKLSQVAKMYSRWIAPAVTW